MVCERYQNEWKGKGNRMLLQAKECSFAVISTLPHCLRSHFNVNQLAKKTPTQCTHTHPLPHIAFKRDFKFPQQANTRTHTYHLWREKCWRRKKCSQIYFKWIIFHCVLCCVYAVYIRYDLDNNWSGRASVLLLYGKLLRNFHS